MTIGYSHKDKTLRANISRVEQYFEGKTHSLSPRTKFDDLQTVIQYFLRVE